MQNDIFMLFSRNPIGKPSRLTPVGPRISLFGVPNHTFSFFRRVRGFLSKIASQIHNLMSSDPILEAIWSLLVPPPPSSGSRLGDGWERSGRRLGRRLGDGWEGFGRRLGDGREPSGRGLGDVWETFGRTQVAGAGDDGAPR